MLYEVITGIVAAVAYALAGVWLAYGVDGFHLVGEVAANGPSNPLHNEVARGGSWLVAYSERPWIVIAPIMGFVGIALAVMGLRAGREVSTLLWSKLAITGIISVITSYSIHYTKLYDSSSRCATGSPGWRRSIATTPASCS